MMDPEYYLELLQANKQEVGEIVDQDFTSAYYVLALTFLSIFMLSGPTLILIVDTWYGKSLSISLAIFSSLSLLTGILLNGVLTKKSKFVGTWKRPTVFLKDSWRLQSAGLHYYPARGR